MNGASGLVANLWLVSGGEWTGGDTVPIASTSFAIGISHNGKDGTGKFCTHGKGVVLMADALLGTNGNGTGTATAMEMAIGHQLVWVSDSTGNASMVLGSTATGNSAMGMYARAGGMTFEDLRSGNSPLFRVSSPSPACRRATTSRQRQIPLDFHPFSARKAADTSITMQLASKGSGAVNLISNGVIAFSASAPSASDVNYIQATPNTAGLPPILSAQGSDASITMQLASKGSGAVNLISNGVIAFSASAPNASDVNYIQATSRSRWTSTHSQRARLRRVYHHAAGQQGGRCR